MLRRKGLLSICCVFLAVFGSLSAIRPLPTVLAEQSPKLVSSADLLAQPEEPNTDAPNLRFDRLSVADGLSFSFTTSIFQDRQGFMWFGTRYGLNQFDGFNFTVHMLGTSGDILFANYIRNIYEDRTGDLWISNLVDLVRKDKETGEFIHYIPDASNPESLWPGQIYPIAEDPAGNVWIGTTSGLNRYEAATDTFTHYLKDVSVLSFLVDRRGGIWLGTFGQGLWHYPLGSLAEEEPEKFLSDPSNPDTLSENRIRSIFEDQQGIIWVGTYDGGLNRLDPATGKITHFKHDPGDPQSLSHNGVRDILEDEQGRMWIGTDDGLNLFDRGMGRFFQYHFDPGDPQSLSSDTVWDIYEDFSGVIWFATLAGISKLNETASTFTHYPQTSAQPSRGWGTQSVTVLGPHHPPELSDNAVSAVYQDRQGILWIGTNTTFRGELNRVDRSTGTVTVFQHNPDDPTSLNGGPIYVIYEDQGGTLWIGSLNGLNRFNPETQSFQSEAMFQHRVTSVIEDQQGALWVGYWGGLYRRKPGDSTFSSVSLDRELSSDDRIYAIYPDRTGAVWISFGNIGLYRLDPATEGGSEFTLIHFPQDRSDPKSPGIGTVMSFYEDLQDTLWMGSVEGGLVRFNRDTQTFTHYLPDTRPGRYVGCIQGDAQGFLWMSTELGLARFDPRRETFSYFDSRDGLVIGENAEALACFQNQQGEMFFGSSKGLNSFFPMQIQDNPNLPPVVITALNLRNQPLRTNLAPNQKIRLSYLQNYLSFDFAALDYTAPAKNQYAYKMDGLDTGWVDAGARRHADYPDLKPGTYTFRVKASNNSGVWNEQGATVEITITPPFWQTWWFIGLVGVLLAGIVVGGVRMRLKDVEAYSRKLESQVASRTAELETSLAQFAALQETSQAVASTLELNSLLNLIIQQATTLLKADGGFVNIVDWEKGVDEVVAIAGIAPPMIGERTPLESGLSGWVTLHNQATISNQIPEDNRVAQLVRSWVKEAHIQSAAVAPLIVKGKVKGTLLVMGSKEGKEKFVQADLDLLVAFANQAAIAIENANLYEQSKKLAVLEERSRLARELHDAVTQTLFSANLVADALPTVWEKDPQEGRDLLKELRGLSRGALAEMRSLLLELRPSALVETRLGDLLRQLGEATSGRAGIPVSVQVEGQAELPPDVHITFYRIAQEALSNIVKHARAGQANVRLSYSNHDIDSITTWLKVGLTICDDGRGFDPAQIPHNRLGLGIMQERAQAIGASLTITSQPGRGTEITARWEQAGKEEAI